MTVEIGSGASADSGLTDAELRATPVPVSDGGSSLTVDGTVSVSNFPASVEVSNDAGNPLPVSGTVGVSGTVPVSGPLTDTELRATPVPVSGTVSANLNAGSNAIGKLASNDGVDIGDVTINNASGASAVNIQDGGNSITVDGTITVNDMTSGNQTTKIVNGVNTVSVASSGNMAVEVRSSGQAIQGLATNTDDVATSSSANSLRTANFQFLYDGATFDRQRTPSVFKTATATASGDTALWVPSSSSLKFRLMRYQIQITADAAMASGGILTVTLRDNTTALAAALSVFVPTVASTVFGPMVCTGWVDLGNGILSSTDNNTLNINLSSALTSGTVRVVACGTEED